MSLHVLVKFSLLMESFWANHQVFLVKVTQKGDEQRWCPPHLLMYSLSRLTAFHIYLKGEKQSDISFRLVSKSSHGYTFKIIWGCWKAICLINLYVRNFRDTEFSVRYIDQLLLSIRCLNLILKTIESVWTEPAGKIIEETMGII